jgi:hypothetical protein
MKGRVERPAYDPVDESPDGNRSSPGRSCASPDWEDSNEAKLLEDSNDTKGFVSLDWEDS